MSPGDMGVYVDIAAKCLVYPGQPEGVMIGTGAPGTFTTEGEAVMREAKGVKYQTQSGSSCNPNSVVESNGRKDAIATGIPENDAVGKWIHKVESKGGKPSSTLGCIGLAPAEFCRLKEYWERNKGKVKIKICNGEKAKWSKVGSALYDFSRPFRGAVDEDKAQPQPQPGKQ